MPVANGYLGGLGLSNSGTDATNDIIIATGACVDQTNTTLMRLTTSLAKQLDAAWAVGTNAGWLDTGAIGNTTYHAYIIQRTDTGVVDCIASTSASAPVLPTNYILSRRIGSILRESAAIIGFTQEDNYFRRNTGVSSWSVTNPGTAAVTRTLSTPVGINVIAEVHGQVSGQAAGQNYSYVSDLATTDEAASNDRCQWGGNQAALGAFAGWAQVRTNTSAQVRTRIFASDAGTSYNAATIGWTDRRGQG